MAKASSARQKQRHDPLYKDLTTQGGNLRTKARGMKKEVRDEDQEYIDSAASRKILQLAKEQQEEIEREESQSLKQQAKFAFGSRFVEEEEDDDNEEDYEDISEFGSDEEYEFDEDDLNEEDAKLFEQYLQESKGAQEFGMDDSYNLADKIMASIRQKEEQQLANDHQSSRPEGAVLLPPKVIAAYTGVGEILSTYTHGKLPKLFKVIPSLNNWEDVLYVTNPDKWTPHAVYEATKLFVSNLTAKQAQRFVENVLLERFRIEIEDSETHSLNYHIYRALKKALYKPGAFFQGFLFPLVENGCSVREATIAGSILTKISIPQSHSSAALNYLLGLEFSPASTVFIRVLLEKKYALPYQIIDECFFYFIKFRNIKEESMDDDTTQRQVPSLPVVWHKAFLAFALQYKNDITDEQRDLLLETVRQRGHKDIGPEIRRELLAGKPREEPVKEKETAMIDAF
jgi:essential nuclear protein 1